MARALIRPSSVLTGLVAACWGALAVEQSVVAAQDRRGPVEPLQRADRDDLGCWLVVGDAAGLHQHHRCLGHAGVDRLAHRLGERVGGQVPVGQQHLDQRPGPLGVTVLAAGSGPEGVVSGRERAALAGLSQRGRARQRPGLSDQDLQVVVQHQALAALGDRPLMAGDHLPARADLQEGRAQPQVDPPAAEAGRDRVVVLAHTDAGLVVDPVRRQQPGRVEWGGRQGQQVRLLGGEVLADGAGAMANAPVVIGGVCGPKVLVQLGQ